MLRSFNKFIFIAFAGNDFSLLLRLLQEFFLLRGIQFNNDYSIPSLVKGFEFMFWNLSSKRKFLVSDHFPVQISKNFIKNYKCRLKNLIKSNYNKSIITLLKLLNYEILSWINSNVFSDDWREICSELDTYVYKILWRYVKKCHPRRPCSWIYSKYWKCFSGLWRFFVFDDSSEKIIFLKSHFILQSKFYRIASSLNVYSKFDRDKFFLSYLKKSNKNFTGNLNVLFNEQKGLCFLCNRPLSLSSYKLVGVSKIFSVPHNLFLVHSYCNLP